MFKYRDKSLNIESIDEKKKFFIKNKIMKIKTQIRETFFAKVFCNDNNNNNNSNITNW
jgi:hypothetical protein